MDIVIIALIIVAVWIVVVVVVLAVCRAAAHADADEEQYLAQRRDDVSNPSLAPYDDANVGDDRPPSERAARERGAERLPIELPERARLRLTRLVESRRHRS